MGELFVWQKMADQCDKALGGIRSGDNISVGGVTVRVTFARVW